MASSWIGKYVLDCNNIVKTNIEAHKVNGIALCVLTLIHVWSILLPCLTHKWKAQVVPGMFEWPLSERAPPGFKDANPATETMSLQVDDVFRMVEMTILLGILTPLSIRWMQQCWHLGIQVHRFITVIYFVDIVRRHSHPHNWVLNTPIFAIWILDKVLCMAWRRIKAPNVVRHVISDDYMVLFWSTNDIDEGFNEVVSVGSNYYMKLYPSSWMESRHPFTAFKNRSSADLIMKSEHCFSNGAVIRTFDNDRKPRIGGHVESRSHTERMSTYSPSMYSSLSIWGPFQGQVTNLISKALLAGKDSTSRKNLVLAGSGSAINFMIDLMSHLSSATSPLCYGVLGENVKNITLLYSTRDEALYHWVHETMKSLLGAIVMPADENKCTSNGAHIRILLACTAINKTRKKRNSKSENKDVFPISNNKTEHMIEDFTLHNHHDFVEEEALIPSPSSSTYNSKPNSATSQSADDDDIDEEQATAGAPGSAGGKNIEGDSIFASQSSSIDLLYQRLDYGREIPDGSDVFCQGSVAFKNVVKEGCNKKKNVRVFFDQ